MRDGPGDSDCSDRFVFEEMAREMVDDWPGTRR